MSNETNQTMLVIDDGRFEELTPQLRWYGGTLQQAWKIVHYKNGQPVGVELEWRDVPIAEEENPSDKPSSIPMAHENKYGNGSGTMAYYATKRLIEGSLGKFHCDECEDEREHYHNATATGVEIDFENGQTYFTPPPDNLRERRDEYMKARGFTLGSDKKQPVTWLCVNHPPGSEIEVKKGENCSVCNRGEE